MYIERRRKSLHTFQLKCSVIAQIVALTNANIQLVQVIRRTHGLKTKMRSLTLCPVGALKK